MATRQVLQTRIIDTSLGTLKVSLTAISGYDVDELVSQRVRAEGARRQMYLLGQESDPSNNENTVFPTDFISDPGGE